MERSGGAIKRSSWRLLLTFCTKTSDGRGVSYVLTVGRLGSTLSALTCASERSDIAVARPERVLGSRRATLNSTWKNYYEIIDATSRNHTSRLSGSALRPRSGKRCRLERSPSQSQADGRRLG